MIDVFWVDIPGRSTVQQLVTFLQQRLSGDERQYLLDDPDAWERKIPADTCRTMAAISLLPESGETCPFTLVSFRMLTADLWECEQWVEVLCWRAYIIDLSSTHRRAA